MSFRNILLVDANVELSGQLSRSLQSLGYHVEVAQTGAAAMRLAGAVKFDVGIFSEFLPDGEGAALFQRVTSLQQGLRGVLLAAVGDLTTVWAAISAGMQRVVTRPVDVAELLPVVEAHQSNSTPIEPGAPEMLTFDEQSICELTSGEIQFRLSRDELIAIICAVEYPFAGKDRLSHFDRDTLERVVHLVRRWCQARRTGPS